MIQPIQFGDLSNRLISLTGIDRPYFAIQHPKTDQQGRLCAQINHDSMTQGEQSLISAAHAAQHMAVLSSCCLALQLPDLQPHYFLVRNANLNRGENTRVILRNGLPYPGALNLEAKVIRIDGHRKTGEVKSYIYTPDRHLIFQMDTAFRWVPVNVYERVFRQYRMPGNHQLAKTITPENIPIIIEGFSKNAFTGTIGRIEPEWCAGHFEQFPNLPMSALGDVLSRMAAMHLKLMLKNHQLAYSVKQAISHVLQPVFAGEKVYLRSVYLEAKHGDYTFSTIATNADGAELGKTAFTFSIHHADKRTASGEMHYFPIRSRRAGEEDHTIIE